MDRDRVSTLAETADQGTDSEARAELVGMAKRSFGVIPAELLAEHVLRLDARADWPIRREAMEALKRRYGFAERDELRLTRRPAGGAFGEYETRARGKSTRPYRTLLESIQPVRGSCGCRDFRRSSLGLCKHLLVVLDALAKKPRVWRRALLETPVVGGRLAWDPRRPLLGADDWLERVRFVPTGIPKSRLPRIAQRFAPGTERVPARSTVSDPAQGTTSARTSANDPAQEMTLVRTFANDPAQRMTLVRDLARYAAGGDPALKARLDEELERLDLLLALRANSQRMKRSLVGLKRKLYPYQRVGVARFLAQGRLLLADDMGLGKTVQAIAAGHALYGAGIVKRGLLVVPASLKNQWLREWQATSDVPISIVEGSQPERERIYEDAKRGFLIANYEQLLRDLSLIERWSPDFCVLDEAQRIKNWEARTSHAVKTLRPRLRLVLTGTPMENRLSELASIVEWVDDHALEPQWRLAPLHSTTADGKQAIVGARNLETLRARLAPCCLRRVRSEVLDQLPGRTDTTIPIDLTGNQREAHQDLVRPIASLVKITERRPLTQQEFLKLMQLLTRQRQICNGLALVDFLEVWPTVARRRPSERVLASLDSPKLAELRSLVESLVVDQGRKVVVFSQWRRMLELASWAVSDLLSASGKRAVFFSGQEGARRRVQNLVDFHDDPAASVLFSTDAGSVGLNLQRAANACVLLELPWNPAVLEQRVGRIHRLGQKDKIDVYAIVARGGIEERIAGLVADKRALFRGLFDGVGDDIQFDRSGSFLEQIRRTVSLAPEFGTNGAGVNGEVDDEEDADADTDADDEEDAYAYAASPSIVNGDGYADADADSHTDAGAGVDAEEVITRASKTILPEEALASPAQKVGEPPASDPRASIGDIERQVDGQGDGRRKDPSSDPGSLAGLISGLTVERAPDGGLRILAPPESAGALAALFETLARSLRNPQRDE